MRSKTAILAHQSRARTAPLPREELIEVGGTRPSGGFETFLLTEVVSGGLLLKGKKWKGKYTGTTATGVGTKVFYILRAPSLRNEPERTFAKNGVSFAPMGEQTRVATMPDSTTKTEAVTPPYTEPATGFPGEEITAVDVGDTGYSSPDGAVRYLEINDGRVWGSPCS